VRFNSSAILSRQQHDWPGNVRELANLVEPRVEIPAAQPFAEQLTSEAIANVAVDANSLLQLNEERLRQYLDNFERQLLAVALEDCAGLVDYAAERVQLDVASFKARLQLYGLLAPAA
jgi:DNA-binding NtrC family response regulator